MKSYKTKHKQRFKGLLRVMQLAALSCALLTPDAQAAGRAEASAFNDPGARSASGAVGDLAPVETQVNGGEITVGASAQVVVLFRNDSGRPVTTGAIQLYPSSTVSSSVSLNECSKEPLPAGAVCAVALSIKGLQQGSWRIEMLMRHSGRSRLVTATLAGQISGGDGNVDRFVSDIESIPDEVDFGTLNAAQPLIRGIVLRNITSDPIDINSIYIEAAEQAGYSLRTDCSSLTPGQACIITVKWSPVLRGDATGILLVEHTGPTSIASINLSGTFEPTSSSTADIFPQAVPGKGLLVSSQNQIDFGDNIESTSAITISLVNVGDSPMTIQDISMANNDTGLTMGRLGCAAETVLAPVEACPLTITWNPVREGEILDDIRISHDGARGVLILPVRGEASAAINREKKAVRLVQTLEPTTAPDTTTAPKNTNEDKEEATEFSRDDDIDAASVLDGFVVTSHANKKAIIAGPGGSRIVFDGREIVIGGFVWDVKIRTSGVELSNGSSKVLLLFDRSLSSLNGESNDSSGG